MNRSVPKPIPQVRPTKGDAVVHGMSACGCPSRHTPSPGSTPTRKPTAPSPLPSFTPAPRSPSLRSGQPSAGETGCQGAAGTRGRRQAGLGNRAAQEGGGRHRAQWPHGRRCPSAECEPRKAGDTWPRGVPFPLQSILFSTDLKCN